jgi:hypothetical protein
MTTADARCRKLAYGLDCLISRRSHRGYESYRLQGRERIKIFHKWKWMRHIRNPFFKADDIASFR